jgi:hypothetical protein
MIGRHRLSPLLLPALAILAGPASALEVSDGKLNIGAFGSVGYGRTDDNTYGPGNEDGQYDNTVFALSVVGHATDRLMVAGQIHLAGEAAEIDWAFAEWKVNDRVKLRLGKAKHPFGNYGETLDVGTLRPFFELPTVVYGPSHIVADGYTGAGLAGFHRINEGWSLGYDLYAGELHLVSYHATDQLAQTEDAALDPALWVAPGELEPGETRDVIGGRLTVNTPVEGLVARLSAYTGSETHGATGDDVRHSAYAVSGEYLGESLSLRAEYALLTEVPEITTNATYLEAAWMFANGLQLSGRLEGSWSKPDDFNGSSALLRHNEAAIGLNYWFSPDLVVKTSYHFVDGNRFAYLPWPDGVAPATLPKLEQTTHLFVVGAQFSL